MVFFPIATAAVSCLALHLQHQRNFYSSYSLKNKSYQSNQPQSYSGRVPPTAILNSNIGRRRRTTGKQLQMTQDEQQQLSQRKTMRSMPLVPSSRSPAEAQLQIQDYTREMNQRHQQPTVFTDEEVEGVVHSLQNVVPPGFASLSSKNSSNAVLPDLLRKVAHLSHKDWSVTDQNAIALSQALSLSSLENAAASMEQNVDPAAAVRLMLERILRDGNWKGAAAARAEASSKGGDSAQGQHQQQQPWVVLVTGVNGIRKTTSIYQTWFPDLLQDALVAPREATTVELLDKARLPNGSNSFFRQLDHMIATLCNEEFAALYALTRDLVVAVDGVEESASQQPTAVVIQMYSNLKAAIFSRYRTLSELLGVGLVREAQKQRLNCMLETSGRDVAMFHYVDHFFGRPDDEININGKRPNPAENPPVYRKLALHFTINDLQHAKDSVDRRMKEEIQAGIEALKHGDVFAIINANAGGPYGSEVLEGVQADSNRVWNEDVMAKGGVGQDWYKATIQINAHETKPWTAQAVKPDGSMGQEFIFKRD